MKKVISMLVVLVIAASCVFAAPLLQLGPTVQYNASLKNISEDKNINFNNFQYGADVRVNLLFLQAGVNSLYGKSGEYHTFDSVLSANILISPVRQFNISVGMGPSVAFQTKDFKEFLVNGSKIENFGDVLLNSPLNYRAQANVNFGFLGVSASYMIPTTSSFKSFDFKQLAPVWDSGKFAVSLLFNIF